MSDDLDDPLKHMLGALTIAPGGFLLLWADADTEQGETTMRWKRSRCVPNQWAMAALIGSAWATATTV